METSVGPLPQGFGSPVHNARSTAVARHFWRDLQPICMKYPAVFPQPAAGKNLQYEAVPGSAFQ
jgi:hypothetical protein